MNTSAKHFKEASILSLERAAQDEGTGCGETILRYKWPESSMHHSFESNRSAYLQRH